MRTSTGSIPSRHRAWLTTGLAVLAFSMSMSCSISDNNGEPALPGLYNPGGDNGGGDPIDPLVRPAFLVPQVGDMLPGDTLRISVTLIDENTSTPGAPGIASAWVRMIATPGSGWQNADSMRTDAYGRVTFRYVDTTQGTHTLTFRYGTVSSAPVSFNITPTPRPVQRRITIRVDDHSLAADGKSFTNVYVTVINENNNPLVGEAIQFITTSGVIAGANPPTPEQSGIAITNESGIAVARLTSTSINDTAIVLAYVVSAMTLNIETKVAFQGVHIDLAVDTTNLLPGQTTVITATVLNGSNEPVVQYPIQWILAGASSSSFTILARDTMTGFSGEATLLLRADTSGTDSVIVASAGARAVLSLNVTSLKLRIQLDQTQLVASDTAKTNLRVTFTDLNDTPIPNGIITVVRHYPSAAGVMQSSTLNAVTDAGGQAIIVIPGIAYDGTVRLSVTARQPPPSQNMATAEATIRFSTTRNLTIEALPTIIQADGSSRSEITVTIKNDKGNPIVGDTVEFSTTAGLIAAYAVTNQWGQAVAALRSDRRNVTTKVKAVLRSDITKADSVNVVFAGVTLVANASPRSIRGDGQDTSYISITLTDAMGNVIPGEPVNWSVQKRDTTIVVPGFDQVTDNRGTARCKVVGTGSGSDTLTIVAAGATARPVLFYSSNLLTIDTAAGQSMVANGVDSTQMIALYTDGGGTPLANIPVSINVTIGALGTVFAQTLTTDASGRITFYMRNPTFSNIATVSAEAVTATEVTTATAKFYFRASIIKKISLKVTPKTIGTNGDKATIIAIAYDSLNNRVANAQIAFNILEGPGGGEYLDPPNATTGIDGMATSSLVSGAVPSMYREVEIVAGDFEAVKSDTVRLTIAGPPHYITVGTNILKGLNPDDGTFGLPCAAIVSDINGNPVADGTPVTFSAKVTGVVAWEYRARFWNYLDGGIRYWHVFIDTVPVILPFEDLNDNYKCDEGEDRNYDGVCSRGKDLNGDGIYNPGPAFVDINNNGRRDSGVGMVEPMRITGLGDTIFADYNGNLRLDIIEPLVDKHLDSTLSWEDYVAMRNAAQGGFGYDYFASDDDVVDPNSTAISITRTVQTVDGKAVNELWYGQSYALKMQVAIWAEAQGITTSKPQYIMLPVIE